jgi:hypothetical protein
MIFGKDCYEFWFKLINDKDTEIFAASHKGSLAHKES